MRFLGCDPHLADDLTQETFISVFDRPFEIRDEAASSSYLRTSARNFFISHKRRTARIQELEEREFDDLKKAESLWTSLVVGRHQDETIALLDKCKKQLSERALHAIDLKYSSLLTHQEVGQELGISEEGARKSIQRSLKILGHCIEERGQA